MSASTFVLFEESGSFRAGRIMTDSNGSLQVELPTGKRTKVKANQVFFQFTQPEAMLLLPQAESLANTLDLNFLWECAPQDEFGFEELAKDYFSQPSVVERTALLLRLHSAPVYFYRKGRGRYRPAPPEILQAALQAVARKEQQLRLQAEYAEHMMQGSLPEAVRQALPGLLFKPDKNSIEFKALETAGHQLQLNSERLLLKLGGFAHPYALHMQRFLHACFPRGAAFPEHAIPAHNTAELPLAAVQAFSIDDSTTTEIDDAFSVTPQADGWRIGIHIAAPGLALTPDSDWDKVARQRLSTVYMPGHKITMLPDGLIQHYTLAAGQTCPALSLYVDIDASYQITSSETRVERVPIAANLRHDQLDSAVTAESLAAPSADYPFHAELAVLWQTALQLSQQREAVRGKPEQLNRVDYNFYVDHPNQQSSAAVGDELGDEQSQVRIVARQRNAPLDRLVAEFMILANSSWGKLLGEHGIPGIYRVQQNFRTRMQSRPGPHEGLGVAQYAWSTSPLRRYTDLVNQWQLLSIVQQTQPTFKDGSAELFAIISAFDAAYTSYNDFQTQMERYWCLRWLGQEHIQRTQAVVLKEDLVRLRAIPLYVRVPDLPAELRGAKGRDIEIELLAYDLVDLSVQAKFISAIAPREDALSAVDEFEGEDEVQEQIAAPLENASPSTTEPSVENSAEAPDSAR